MGEKVRGLVWCRGAALPCSVGLLHNRWWWGANAVLWLENGAALGFYYPSTSEMDRGGNRHVVTVRERRIGGQGLSGGACPLSR